MERLVNLLPLDIFVPLLQKYCVIFHSEWKKNSKGIVHITMEFDRMNLTVLYFKNRMEISHKSSFSMFSIYIFTPEFGTEWHLCVSVPWGNLSQHRFHEGWSCPIQPLVLSNGRSHHIHPTVTFDPNRLTSWRLRCVWMCLEYTTCLVISLF